MIKYPSDAEVEMRITSRRVDLEITDGILLKYRLIDLTNLQEHLATPLISMNGKVPMSNQS